MSYNFTAQWVKGTKNEAADALSRHPLQTPCVGDDDLAEREVDIDNNQTPNSQAPSLAQIRASTLQPEEENLHLHELRQHAEDDQEYQDLRKVIVDGFPNQRGLMTEPLKKFWAIKDNLSVDDGLIVYGCRLFIPTSLRATMLQRLHEAHQGISRSQARARLTIYTGLGLTGTLSTLSRDVVTAKTTYHPTLRKQWSTNHHPRGPFNRSLLTSLHMEASSSSLRWIVKRTGQTLSKWGRILQHQSSLVSSGTTFVVRQHRTCSGPMVDPNSHHPSLLTSSKPGACIILGPLHITHKVMTKWKPQ